MKNTYIISAFLVLMACKPHQQTVSTPQPAPRPQSAQQQESEKVYRLIISFTSKGSGADGQVRKAVEDYVKTYPKTVAYQKVPWGREGEADYLFSLSELSPSEQEKFVSEIRKIARNSELVELSENQDPVHNLR